MNSVRLEGQLFILAVPKNVTIWHPRHVRELASRGVVKFIPFQFINCLWNLFSLCLDYWIFVHKKYIQVKKFAGKIEVETGRMFLFFCWFYKHFSLPLKTIYLIWKCAHWETETDHGLLLYGFERQTVLLQTFQLLHHRVLELFQMHQSTSRAAWFIFCTSATV